MWHYKNKICVRKEFKLRRGQSQSRIAPIREGGELGPISDAIKYSQKGAEALFPSTKPVFNRYWSGDIAKGAFNTKTGLFSKQFWKPDPDPRYIAKSKMMKSPNKDCKRNVPKKKKGKIVGYYGFECEPPKQVKELNERLMKILEKQTHKPKSKPTHKPKPKPTHKPKPKPAQKDGMPDGVRELSDAELIRILQKN